MVSERSWVDYWNAAPRDELIDAAIDYFGQTPNRHLTTKHELRFGNKGSLSVALNSGAAGMFNNFETGESGCVPPPDESDQGRVYVPRFWYKHGPKPMRSAADTHVESPQDKLRAAQALWGAFGRPIAGTPAAAYLDARGISSSMLPEGVAKHSQRANEFGIDHTILFPYRVAPANLRADKGQLRGVQRIKLRPDGSAVVDANGVKVKKARGDFNLDDGAGEAFFICRGDPQDQGPVYVTEGVEDALSVRQAFLGRIDLPIPTVVGVIGQMRFGRAAERLGIELGLPLVFVPDRGDEERPAQAAAMCGGKIARVWTDGDDVKDANDALRKAGPDALVSRLLAAVKPGLEPAVEAKSITPQPKPEGGPATSVDDDPAAGWDAEKPGRSGGGGGGGGGDDGGDGDDDGDDDGPPRKGGIFLSGIKLIRGKDGAAWNLANCLAVLERHEAFRNAFAMDVFNEEPVLLRRLPNSREPLAYFKPRPLRTGDLVLMGSWFNRNKFPNATVPLLEQCVRFIAEQTEWNPVTTYLDGLVWDGTPRLGTWLIDYAGAKPSRRALAGDDGADAFVREASTRWMISAAARAYEPGCQADHVLVLEGLQGIGKSKLYKSLMPNPEWFSDNVPPLHSKDASQALRGRWIIELAELAALKKNEVEAVKAFITRTVERYRPPWDRLEKKEPRRCVFGASTNASEYLTDSTGNRRFWPITVTKIDAAGIRAARDQLWAEAVALYKAGERWWIEGDLIEVAARETEARVEEDPWTPLIREALLGKREVTTTEILRDACGVEKAHMNRQQGMRVAAILRDLGWVKVGRTNRGKIYAPENEPGLDLDQPAAQPQKPHVAVDDNW